MGPKQEGEPVSEDREMSEKRRSPVTVLETFSPEHAYRIIVGALKDGGREEMHKFLGLKLSNRDSS